MIAIGIASNGSLDNAFDDILRNPVFRRHSTGALFRHSRKCWGTNYLEPFRQLLSEIRRSQNWRLFSASTRRSRVAIKATRDGSNFYSKGVQ
ncbi:hypothetical protein CEXT_781581 [Caerostris extrusa]|uniref:Uncharacterized protein n=1 Tax=Caerostris extrusa TaxID=172846 RepID=A0AAV4YGE5_CAEEX|nr:hypothetical protein CEXT_781581 [Caerostris extrusa]